MKKKSQDGLVSVIIPTYNRGDRILDSINSVLNQSYNNLELIVVDDGSTDNTQEVLNSIKDKRLKVIYQNNKGACAARNNGILHASGKYIAFHDSDDTWKLDKLEKQLRVLLDYDVDIVFCKMVDESNSNIIIPQKYHEGIIQPMNDVMGISTQTLMGKREIFQNVKFDENIPRLQDTDILIRLAKRNYKFYCMDEPLVDYKVWDDSISKNPQKLLTVLKIFLKKYPNLFQEFPIIYSELKASAYAQAKFFIKKGDKKLAQDFLNVSLKYNADNTGINFQLERLRNYILLKNINYIHRVYAKKDDIYK